MCQHHIWFTTSAENAEKKESESHPVTVAFHFTKQSMRLNKVTAVHRQEGNEFLSLTPQHRRSQKAHPSTAVSKKKTTFGNKMKYLKMYKY